MESVALVGRKAGGDREGETRMTKSQCLRKSEIKNPKDAGTPFKFGLMTGDARIRRISLTRHPMD
jgi:hypothetical protein